MLLTITYQGPNAADLGYLLHKNPARAQHFPLSHGIAYVFYPKLEENVATAALLIELDPIALARGKIGQEGGLFDYVNDRPYVASSFLSVAISRVFGTAMAGRCEERPMLAAAPIPLEAEIAMLPCHGGEERLRRVFEPLGYTVACCGFPLDDAFPNWGKSPYYRVKLQGTVRLCDLLNHLYVLIPVFDGQKHYWLDQSEIEKLLYHGKGWLATHPEKEYITRRYFNRKRSLANRALMQLMEKEPDLKDMEETTPKENLNSKRLHMVLQAVRESGAKSVIDLGCGEGKLLGLLLKEKQLLQITGVDVSLQALDYAKQRLHLDKLQAAERVKLFQGSLTYRDKRFAGYDAACVVEVLEHLDLARLPAFAETLFHYAAPKTIILTTPNADFNTHYTSLKPGELRHPDHRFEWGKEQFEAWANKICAQYGYQVKFMQVGGEDKDAPTQIGVFTK